ncbi:MAG: hypothetical protein HWE14_11630 [Flavobacteriia bacterium]|nr:hypothetical protein [Flavobacteriia bacterium]
MKWTSLAFCTLISVSSLAQLEYNIGVDTTSNYNAQYLSFLEEYFEDMASNADSEPSTYFADSDLQQFAEPDYIMKLLGERRLYQHATKTVLSVREMDEYTRIQVMFTMNLPDYPFQVYGIGNYYLVREGEQIKLRIPAAVLTSDWHTATVRHVRYHFPPYHSFNRRSSAKLQSQIEKLEEDWSLEPIEIEYYFTDTQDEIEAIKGFEYSFYMAKNIAASGFAYIDEAYTFSSGWGEEYFHEIVHIYLNPLYPDSPLLEGLAVFYGGSMGHEAKWHYDRLAEYLRENPNISPSSSDFYYMDEKTNPQSTIAASICSRIYQKEGVEGLKRVMEYTSFEELYREEFQLEDAVEIDRFIRQNLIELSE